MYDVLIDNKNLYNLQLTFLNFFSIISKIMVVLFIFGFFQEKPLLIIKINFIVKFMLGIYLMYRFNNYRKYKIVFTELDRKICYSVGIYIIIISIGENLLYLSSDIRTKVISYIKYVFKNKSILSDEVRK